MSRNTARYSLVCTPSEDLSQTLLGALWVDKVPMIHHTDTGIFLGLIWGPVPIKNQHKLPKMVYIIPNFLGLHFGEYFLKFRIKLAKLQIHEFFLNFYAICHEFILWALATNILQLYTTNFLCGV